MVCTYYVYALKDTSINPARPFYIGKGTGTRAYDHLVRTDDTAKGARIRKILDSGASVLVTMLAEGLDEHQAIRLEAELISAFGTEATGGLLTNSVVPSGNAINVRRGVNIPAGVQEKAQIGVALLKEAVLELAKADADGVTNSDVSKALGLQSDYGGGSKDYLAWSLLGLLMREGKIKRNDSIAKGRHVSNVV